MARLSQADAVEFQAIKALCYSGLDSATLRERAGDRLARHFRAASFCFGASDPATALPVHSVTVGLGPESIAAFLRLVLATPALDFSPWVKRPQRVARLEELVDDVERDPYMTEVLRPAGLRYDMQTACVSSGRTWGHLCLRRSAEEGPYAGGDLRLLAAVVPHLTAGLRAAAARAALAAAPGALTGVVVLGPDGSVELTNGVAQRLFSRPASGTRHSFLTAVNIVAAQLERALSDEGAALSPALILTDESKGEVYRLRAERVAGADGRPRGLILIEPAASWRAADADAAAALVNLGLTPRESEVALAALRGRHL